MLALWAEMDVAVADQFRDGNVPAHSQLLGVTQRAFQALPDTIQERCFRGDSACWEKRLVNWLLDKQARRGPAGKIGFAIGVRMTRLLKEPIERIAAPRGKPYRQDSETEWECADVLNYGPEEVEDRPAGAGPLRHVAIRVRKRQRPCSPMAAK